MVTSRFRPWLHSVQWYSAIVVMVSLLFAGTGVVWAWFRPTYSAEIVEDNQVRVGTEVNVEFLSLAIYCHFGNSFPSHHVYPCAESAFA